MNDQDDLDAAWHHKQELEQQWWLLSDDSELWKRHRAQLKELREITGHDRPKKTNKCGMAPRLRQE